jgi:selenide,water dikinase
VLGELPVSSDPRVLVDYRTSDDAGVYEWGDGRALIQTVDFFTPIVDDPEVYGRIAAANALSDVYAMGGRPLTALAIAAFPKEADPAVLGAIFRGGFQALRDAGVALLGGHTVQDQEIKFGYAITGEGDPSRLWTNAGARPGDRLILSKPLGTGIVATAIKFGRAPEAVAAAAVASMIRTNRAAAEALASLPAGAVHACTDVTGFGLIGHATEMARASGVTVSLAVDLIPILPGVLELAGQNSPGGARTNIQHFQGGVAQPEKVHSGRVAVLYDPQTSGGLLVAVDPAHLGRALEVLAAAGVEGHAVGAIEAPSKVAVILR